MKYKNQILKFLGSTILVGEDFQIESLFLDSRKCDDKSAFIALKGQTTDGNKYIDNVLAKGVKLVLSDNLSLNYLSSYNPEPVTELSRSAGSHNKEYTLYKLDSGSESGMATIICIKDLKDKLPTLAKWFYDYKKPQNIIGITGTNGKTSISSYIAQLQKMLGQKSLLLGTNGNGIYPDLQESTHTTLDILSLYQTISYYKNYQNLVMEVSSHSLDQKRVAGLDFDIAVFSNLSHDHLDYHKTMENYFEVKAKLFQFSSLKKAVINIDDEYGQKLCENIKKPSFHSPVERGAGRRGMVAPTTESIDIITVSLKSTNADVYINVKNIHNMQTSFDLYIFQKLIGTYQTSLVGEFNLMNLGLSLAALDGYIAREQLLANIASIKPVKGRMEIIELANNAKIIIDYAHTPDALEKALQTLKRYSKSNLWCIFGCGGDRDATKRPKMAQIAEKYADKVIVTEDNNRFENIENIFSGIKKGFSNPEKHTFITSREKAIRYCIENTSQGDIILLAGKGHECYLDKNGVKEYFDEREIIKNYAGLFFEYSK
ncbi:UDP-N-acetylmuramoyl-L-alanyl-D-glutamate--2,6-diaminopimelate ligase [Francisella opportunistica]|uniref:UDP-N-acetylmuramyl-tripeptide synthetase n=2 Tax=Francisellaceae TaxID=34064 RepID=A0A345JSE6_9GAMM|nr:MULTISPECIES: UDP-N-acetylmuramoyl-L-alanyl-D-glutamate--2,6-diaminopimelate ligase [Francisella]APC92007.1 UDP-N-acetylmuramoylalanyl-D-glutamate--2,6- diaminopimelate ligase [Francisella sp. MA067296]AXH30242.1 UDP-N-acetylmuramoyl-L-alanyl-D-glutamate--2,6-diaminopimelate ligase [Francisella opportunistica]AXH31883.1 UDP-N-acetylmuramoyl-L-alanyl-D-glutamate--2,6-diaminopimelate ligase [Francisella opportunistica]AXH33529.1 UDP-N-acetylmuramoyl-L-alanyl-D-glutamate--2,6-diaminopimelate li